MGTARAETARLVDSELPFIASVDGGCCGTWQGEIKREIFLLTCYMMHNTLFI